MDAFVFKGKTVLTDEKYACIIDQTEEKMFENHFLNRKGNYILFIAFDLKNRNEYKIELPIRILVVIRLRTRTAILLIYLIHNSACKTVQKHATAS